MNRDEFRDFLKSATFNEERLDDRFEETHISWIAFSKSYVFKIKKPVKLSFLDFSSLAQRKKYCERELALNQRFSKIYLDVLPVRRSLNGWSLGEGEGEVNDFAVLMERISSAKRMDKMLLREEVTHENIDVLAQEIASFHQRATVIQTPFDLRKSQALFNDIETVFGIVTRALGKDQQEFLQKAINWSNEFLETYGIHIQKRIDDGFQRDVHGDLHAGNIFICPKPVLFDCIEFEDDFRRIDLLYEIAFLCMEMEAVGYEALSREFLNSYSKRISCFKTREDVAIFSYFLCLRANIRAKVKVIAAGESNQPANPDVKSVKNYLSLMGKYMAAAENAF